MKYLKMLGLAAVAAAAMTAILGAGTASATTLCENNQTTGCTKHVANETELDFSLEPETVATLTDSFGIPIVECKASTVKGKTTSTGSSTTTVEGNITSLSFTECTREVHVNTKTTGTLEIHHKAGTDDGTVTSNDTTVSITNVPFLGTCRYLTNNTDIGTLFGSLGDTDPTFEINALIPTETSGCPNGRWEGSYEYTGTTTFIVAAS
jgi:hypothetical protein